MTYDSFVSLGQLSSLPSPCRWGGFALRFVSPPLRYRSISLHFQNFHSHHYRKNDWSLPGIELVVKLIEVPQVQTTVVGPEEKKKQQNILDETLGDIKIQF